MKKLHVIVFTILIAYLSINADCLILTQENQDIFALRRQRLMNTIQDGIAILQNTGRSQKDFYYLTGFEETEAVILLLPKDEEKFIIFAHPKNPIREMWTGAIHGVEGTKDLLGADKAYPLSQFEKTLPRFLKDKERIFCSFRDDNFHKKIKDMAKKSPDSSSVKTSDLLGYIHEMRLIKSSEEIELLRKSIDITCEAHIEAMKAAQPGMNEYEIEAIIEYVFRKNGAKGPAFPSIVGSGPNTSILHYENNNRQTKERDLVVMDIGAEYEQYAADVTRTIPMNGKFSKEQKEIYEIVLKAQEEGFKLVKPGTMIDDIHNRAAEVIQEGLYRLGLITDKSSQWQMRIWLPYKISHWLGLDVHDVGNYRRKKGESRILEPGMVFTIEPGIYIKAEMLDHVPALLRRFVPEEEEIKDFVAKVKPIALKYTNIGIRIEDDILVTEKGYEDLSLKAPKKIKDIEMMMKKKSYLNK